MKSFLSVAATTILIACGSESGAYANSIAAPLSTANSAKKCPNGDPIFNPEKIKNVRCAVRYHGFHSAKDYDPANPDQGLLKYQTNPRTPGDLGNLSTLVVVDNSETLGLKDYFYSEKDFGLEYTFAADAPVSVEKSGCAAAGDLHFKIFDTVEKRLIAHSSISISSLVSSHLTAHGPNQITVGLPKRLIDAQLQTQGPDEKLLTQVKFQCDPN